MPELPEVEVVKRSLSTKLQNLIIKKVKINDDKLRYRINKNQIRKIVGLKLKKIRRRSKFLLFFFNKDMIMLVHLGMTGKFYFVDRQANELAAGYSANVHPMIVPYKDGAIFVCSEVVTENGERITADFLTVPVGDGYKVIEVIMNNRPSIKKMMGM